MEKIMIKYNDTLFMCIFKLTDNPVTQEKLNIFKKGILFNCGTIKKHFKKRVSNHEKVNLMNQDAIFNFNIIEEHNSVYLIEYDEYIPSHIYELVKNLTAGNFTSLYEIIYPDYELEYINEKVNEEIGDCTKKIIKIMKLGVLSENDILEAKEKLEKIEELKQYQSNYTNSIEYYYEGIWDFIDVEVVEEYPVSELINFREEDHNIHFIDITNAKEHIINHILMPYEKKFNKSCRTHNRIND